MIRSRLAFAVPVCAAVLAVLAVLAALSAKPAVAQLVYGGGDTYYVPGAATLASDVSGFEVLVGKDATGATLSGTATLTVAGGAITTYSGTRSTGYFGLNTFGGYRANITGGSVYSAAAYDSAATTISGGTVTAAVGFNATVTTVSGGTVGQIQGYNASTTAINGGAISQIAANNASITTITAGVVGSLTVADNSTATITGGTLTNAYGQNASTTVVRGGALPNGLILFDSAQADFVGSGLSYAYIGFGTGNPYHDYADAFTVSGTFGGATALYSLYLYNQNGIANTAPRQFALNGVVVAVPEAGTLALILPALGVAGAGIAAHRSRRQPCAICPR